MNPSTGTGSLSMLQSMFMAPSEPGVLVLGPAPAGRGCDAARANYNKYIYKDRTKVGGMRNWGRREWDW